VNQDEWCRSCVCLCDEVIACNPTVATSATSSHDKVVHLCDKIKR